MSNNRDNGGRFRSGQSGNLSGRPKKTRGVDAALMKALGEKVAVTENGRRRNVPKLDVTTRQLVNKGASGDLRAAKMALDMALKAEARSDEALTHAPDMTLSDREIAARVIERLKLILARDLSGDLENNQEADQ